MIDSAEKLYYLAKKFGVNLRQDNASSISAEPHLYNFFALVFISAWGGVVFAAWTIAASGLRFFKPPVSVLLFSAPHPTISNPHITPP